MHLKSAPAACRTSSSQVLRGGKVKVSTAMLSCDYRTTMNYRAGCVRALYSYFLTPSLLLEETMQHLQNNCAAHRAAAVCQRLSYGLQMPGPLRYPGQRQALYHFSRLVTYTTHCGSGPLLTLCATCADLITPAASAARPSAFPASAQTCHTNPPLSAAFCHSCAKPCATAHQFFGEPWGGFL